MRYSFRITPLLDLTEADMGVALTCTFMIVLRTMYYCVVLLVLSLLLYHCLETIKLCLSVFYRPPLSPSSIFDTMCDTLFSINHSNFVILGDFNVNFEVSHHFYRHLSDLMTSFSLSQVVDSPTHFSHCGHSSLIDLVFVSNMSCFSFYLFRHSPAC